MSFILKDIQFLISDQNLCKYSGKILVQCLFILSAKKFRGLLQIETSWKFCSSIHFLDYLKWITLTFGETSHLENLQKALSANRVCNPGICVWFSLEKSLDPKIQI